MSRSRQTQRASSVSSAIAQGRRALAEGRHGDAAQAFRTAARAAPLDPTVAHALGIALASAGQFSEAVKTLTKARDLSPRDASLHMALGDAYFLGGAAAAALPAYLKAAELNPSLVSAWSNAGGIFRDLGDPHRALAMLNRALTLDPTHYMALSNSGLAFSDLCEWDSARDCFDLALQQKPDYDVARWNRAIVDLLRGDFARGWAGHEYRHAQLARMGGLRSFPEERWNGERFDGKRLLVWPEQGLGDQLQFVRFLPRVKARGGTVVLMCAAPLEKMFRELVTCADEIVVMDSDYATCDLQIQLMSIPFILGLGDRLDAECVPYLGAVGEVPSAIEDALPPRAEGLRVGIVWAGQPKHQNDHNRSLSLDTLSSLLEAPDVSWFSLQKGERPEVQLAEMNVDRLARGMRPIASLGPEFNDLSDTAHAISRLDLVITVDTGVAHLAGSMGTATWVLLPFVPDWRWQVNRTDSPWYPSTRLFRQNSPRNWDNVIAQVKTEVAKLAELTFHHERAC